MRFFKFYSNVIKYFLFQVLNSQIFAQLNKERTVSNSSGNI